MLILGIDDHLDHETTTSEAISQLLASVEDDGCRSRAEFAEDFEAFEPQSPGAFLRTRLRSWSSSPTTLWTLVRPRAESGSSFGSRSGIVGDLCVSRWAMLSEVRPSPCRGFS